MNPFFKYALLLVALSFGCRTYVRIPVAGSMPPNFMRTMEGGKKIGIVYNTKAFRHRNGFDATIQSTAETKVNEFRYFTVVDISRREERLKEIVFSQSGLTAERLEFGRELAIDGILSFDVPRPPVTGCTTTSRTEKRRGNCLRYRSTGKRICSRYRGSRCIEYSEERECAAWNYYNVTIYESTRTTTVFLKGELMNVETGAKLAYVNTQPYSDTVEGRYCSSEIDSFHRAVTLAGENVVEHLSPRIVDYSVPVEKNPEGAPPETKKTVKGYLKLGIDSLKSDPPDYLDASRQWQEALLQSNQRSVSALWNLGVYSWYNGQMDQAEKYFARAAKLGGIKFLKGGKRFLGLSGKRHREIIALFRNERERILAEENREKHGR